VVVFPRYKSNRGGLETAKPEVNRNPLKTTNGQVSATVSAGADVGVDFDLGTSIGSVSVDLSGVDYTSNTNRRKVGQTTGYSTKSVQIAIDASTTNGSCSLDS